MANGYLPPQQQLPGWVNPTIMASMGGLMGSMSPKQAPEVAQSQYQGIQTALAKKRADEQTKSEREQLKMQKEKMMLTKMEFDMKIANENEVRKTNQEKASREKLKFDQEQAVIAAEKNNKDSLNFLRQNMPEFIEKYGTEVFYPSNVGKFTSSVNEFLKENNRELPDSKIYEDFNKIVKVAPPSKLILQSDPESGSLSVFRQNEDTGAVVRIPDQYNGLFQFAAKNSKNILAMDNVIKAIDDVKPQMNKQTPGYTDNVKALNDLKEIAKKLNELNWAEEEKKGKWAPEQPNVPGEVSWSKATDLLKGRFYEIGSLGQMKNITGNARGQNKIAQEKLTELKKSGNYEPLEVVNLSHEFIDFIENKHWQFISKAGNIKNKKDIDREFRKKYGYIPIREIR